MITVWAPDGVPEVESGDDLAGHLLAAVPEGLGDGDVVCVTSKVVSKAEGRVRDGDRAEALAEETRRVVARRGPVTIVVNRLGLTMAAAGIDASNVTPGRIVLLPEDPDGSARRLRTSILERASANVAVVVTDTSGRAWREGQIDIAVGAAGLVVLDDHSGRIDAYGNVLAVTAPAVADELAGVAELAGGKLAGRPFAIVRGRGDLVLPPGDDGPGAAALIRPSGSDLFGLGAREAVLAALGRRPGDRAAFGSAVAAEELASLIDDLTGGRARIGDGEIEVDGLDDRGRWVVEVAAYAHGWEPGEAGHARLRLRAATP